MIGNEDWDGYCDERISGAAKNKKESILRKQVDELLALKSGTVDVRDLMQLSKLRLEEYEITRSVDIIRWNKIVIERKMSK